MTVQREIPARQPWMHDMQVSVHAPTQLWSNRDGSVTGSHPHAGAHSIAGFYVADMRILSDIVASINGEELVALSYNNTATGSSEVLAVARNIVGATVDPIVQCEEKRQLTDTALYLITELTNSSAEELTFDYSIRLRVDMSHMQEIKGGIPSAAVQQKAIYCQQMSESRAQVSYQSVTVDINADHAVLTNDEYDYTAMWHLTIPARSSCEVSLNVAVEMPKAVVTTATTDNVWARTKVKAADNRVVEWLHTSLQDLAGLRMAIPQVNGSEFFAAGAPWFFTLFGRDSLWAARFMLPLTTQMAMGTLRTLAHYQATEIDIETNAEPGKIMHELRSEPLTATGAFEQDSMSLPPLYYGTIDATELWIILLAQTWQWHAPESEIQALLPNLKAALAWLRDYADSDGDGFIEYIDKTGHGLSNQGWKDSGDSVRWHDGSLAKGPIALCEVQGYAYQAARLGADVLEHFGESDAQEWRDWAENLKKRFNEQFWVSDERGRYPAIALDTDKKPVDALTSNIGHLLGTGILDEQGVHDVVRQLMRPDMLCCYGIRTMSTTDAGYNPQSYHCGSIWTHDTAIAMLGMYEEGYINEALQVAESLVRAASAFNYQIPELYAGDETIATPAPYPAACHPQAWSAASSVAVLTVLLGLNPDGDKHPAQSPLSLGLEIL